MNEEAITFVDKLNLFWEQHKIGDKKEGLDINYKFKSIGPWDFNYDGAPSFWRERFAIFGFITYLAGWWVIFSNDWQYIKNPWVWLFGNSMVATACGLGLVLLVMWLVVSLNDGTFKNYVKVLDAVIRFIDGRPAIKTELRCKRFITIWSPSTREIRKSIAEHEGKLENIFQFLKEADELDKTKD